MTDTYDCQADAARTLRALRDHFAGRIRPAEESLMRAHLLGCEVCRGRYHRLRLGARFDPRALTVEERLARGLGLTRPRRARALTATAWLAPVLAAAAAALVLAQPSRDPRTEPAARGLMGREPTAVLLVYRVNGAGAPELLAPRSATIAPDNELAFAYTNPAGKRHLLVFGVDGDRRVYWFHPAWPEGAPPPPPLRARPGAGPHELPEAVRHPFAGRSLALYAALSEAPIRVEEVEAAARAPEGIELLVRQAGITLVRQTLAVQR